MTVRLGWSAASALQQSPSRRPQPFGELIQGEKFRREKKKLKNRTKSVVHRRRRAGVEQVRRGRSASGASGETWLAALHDLRQPLQSALLLLSVAGGEADSARRNHALHLAERALTSLQLMLDEVAFACRLQAEASTSKAACRLEEALTLAMADVSGAPGGERIGVASGLPANPVGIDPRIVRLVAQALVATALKDSTAGPVTLAARTVKSDLLLSVEFDCEAQSSSLAESCFVELPAGRADVDTRLFVPGLGLARRIATGLGGELRARFDQKRCRLEAVLPAP